MLAIALIRKLTLRLGEGRADGVWPREGSASGSPISHHDDYTNGQSFAPRGPSTFHERLRGRLPQPLRIRIPKDGPVGRIHHVCAKALNTRAGGADTARFLEHFRYIIVASQLLNEHLGH